MSQHAYHELNYHLCWSTRDRQPLISRSWRSQLLNILADCVRRHDGIPVRQNAMPDHVHLLVRLPPDVVLSQLVEAIQDESAKRVSSELQPQRELAWSPVFGAITFRSEEVEKVSRYIDAQESQHQSNCLSELLERCEDVTSDAQRGIAYQLLYHFSWGTLRRETLLRRPWQAQLLQILAEEVPKRGGELVRHNSMPDHVHLLVKLPPTVGVSQFIGPLKGASSYRVNHEIRPGFPVRWQQGFGVISVREGDIETVSRYIDEQEEHHRRQTLWLILEKLHAL